MCCVLSVKVGVDFTTPMCKNLVSCPPMVQPHTEGGGALLLLPCLLKFPWLDNLKKTYFNRFSAPALSISSLLMSMLRLDLLDCSLPRHVAARGSDPCKKNKKCYRFWFWESFILSSLGRLHHLRLDKKYPMKYCTKLCRIAKHVINALDNSHNNAINS